LFLIGSHLFAQIFPADLFINDQHQQTINCTIVSDIVLVDKKELLDLLTPILSSTNLSNLQNQNNYILFNDLKRCGIEPKFDYNLLRLDLFISPENQKLQNISVVSRQLPNIILEKPADFSAYLNMSANVDIQSSYNIVNVPTKFTFQPVFNYKNWVLDTSISDDTTWGLDYARIVHDFPDNSQRLVLGSLFFPVTGFMMSSSIYGIEFTRNSEMTQGLHNMRSIPEYFSIDKDSNVTMMLNGNIINSSRLFAGRYVVTDIPFIDGINNFSINTQTNLIPYDSKLLSKDDMSYSANFGMPQWQFNAPILSGYFSYGIFSNLTSGINFQTNFKRSMEGIESTYSTPYGNIYGKLAVSEPIDFAIGLNYELEFAYGKMKPVINIGAQYIGENFVADNLYSCLLNASYGQSLPYGFGFNLGFGYQFGWCPNPDQLAANIIITKQLTKNWNFNCLTTANYQLGAWKINIYLTITSIVLNGKAISNFTASTSSVSLNSLYQPAQNLPSFSASIIKDQNYYGNAMVNYSTPFLASSLSESFSSDFSDLSLSTGMAIVMIDGKFGISKPISDSFALIIPKENMKGQTIFANNFENSYDGMSSKNINIGLSDLTSYNESMVTLDSPTAPIDTNFGDVVRILHPTYKSGIALSVGTTQSITVSGKIIYKNAPIIYSMGKIGSVDFFTDETGKFEAYGLQPGEYTIIINNFSTKITIPTGTKFYDIETITVQETQ
jgi:outer membrane usher protein